MGEHSRPGSARTGNPALLACTYGAILTTTSFDFWPPFASAARSHSRGGNQFKAKLKLRPASAKAGTKPPGTPEVANNPSTPEVANSPRTPRVANSPGTPNSSPTKQTPNTPLVSDTQGVAFVASTPPPTPPPTFPLNYLKFGEFDAATYSDEHFYKVT